MTRMPGNLNAAGVGGRVKTNEKYPGEKIYAATPKLTVKCRQGPYSLRACFFINQKGNGIYHTEVLRRVDVKLLAQHLTHSLTHPLLILLVLLDSKK